MLQITVGKVKVETEVVNRLSLNVTGPVLKSNITLQFCCFDVKLKRTTGGDRDG